MKCKMSNVEARGVASVKLDARMSYQEMCALIMGMEEFAQKSIPAMEVCTQLKNARDVMVREMNKFHFYG